MTNYSYWLVCLTLLLAPVVHAADEHGHNEQVHEERGHDEAAHGQEKQGRGEQAHEEHGNEVALTAAQRQAAGIRVEPLTVRSLAGEITAPGEVKLNAYLTRQVTPRITAQIVQRHVALGDHVTPGQVLVTLSSVDMAEAQGALQLAAREWRRVQKLGRETVSDRRYTEARVAFEQARARVAAYGMTAEQIDALLTGDKGAPADGSFQLLAPQAGTVIRDAFIEGEFVEPGRVLFEISDESRVWVEANLAPEDASGVEPGTPARVRAGKAWLAGKVIQSHHTLNETTRTLAVRIEAPNPEERLHPGLFVETRIQGGDTAQVLALPQEAVLRSPDGDWMIFVEDEPDRYKPMEVDVIRTVETLAVIKGVPAGTRVVTQGAFFIQSELAKSGFEVHNH